MIQQKSNVHSYEEKPFKCEECQRCFGLKQSLQRHARTVHQNKKRHQRTVHEDEKPYKCEICQTSFGGKGDLNQHQRSQHENIKPLKIDICQNKIGFKSNLNRHKSTVKIEGYIAQFTEDNPNIGDNMFKFSRSSSDSNSSKIKKEGLDYVGGAPMGFLMSFF